ncbi:heat shock protein-like protein 30 [Amniculicola lignicola CBS 123094]|uniref:Heat shock protein-like protein 30 n=1 Tax=Amniculicola lignicola CBS 123094 TaxID=1392246 RepID=A0A6A5X0M4_9PLEO|nr:heat shock protein-like protein 30 [Amniculicola lignicola CBS 123094]
MSLFPRFTQEFSPLFRLLDDYDRQAVRHFNNSLPTFSPKFDVKETKEAYELHGEFPGIEQKDINIEWDGENTLTVSGRTETVREEGERPKSLEAGNEKKKLEAAKATGEDKAKEHYHKPTVEDEAEGSTQTKEVKKAEPAHKYWVSERSVGEFHRSFSFPGKVDQENVKASLKNGILSIVVPKGKVVRGRKVEVEAIE